MNPSFRFLSIIILFAVSLAAGACRSRPSDAYMTADGTTAWMNLSHTGIGPIQLEPCPDRISTIGARERSYAALLRSLTDLKWRVERTTPSFMRIIAKGCLGVDATLCEVMYFDVDEKGAVTGHVPPEYPIVHKMVGHVARWMHFLDQKFTNYRCIDETLVVEELRKFGLAAAVATTSQPQVTSEPISSRVPASESPTGTAANPPATTGDSPAASTSAP